MPRILFAALFALGVLQGAPSIAQTVGFAEAIKNLSASCGKDISKYCKKENLGNNEIGKCLERNKAKVSAQCNTDRAKVAALLEARFAAQAAAPEMCARDAAQLCKGVVKGSGFTLRCLLKAKPSVSKKCNQAIDLAGFR